MTVPCVRVPREDGEAARQELAAAGLVDQSHEIVHEDGQLYIPVTDPAAISEYTIVEYAAAQRETQTTPDDLIDFSASYERLGEVIIIDEDDPDRASALSDALVESDLPVKTVLNRASKIRGEKRVRDWEILFGTETEALHREYGCAFALDVAAVYFSPRLATERHRVTEQVEDGEQLVDMFAGVGPFTIPAAKRGGDVVGVDINERAIEYLRSNAERNGVGERVTALHGDVREIADKYDSWADRLFMNLPHSANEFVETAVALAGDRCVLHYYDIQHEDDLFGPGEQAIRAAAEPEYDVTVLNRHTVRSYAPHEYNVVLDVALSRS